MKMLIDFIVRSSADPRKTSLMVKGFLLGIVTVLSAESAQWLGLLCDFSSYCYYIDPSIWEEIKMLVSHVAELVFYILSAASTVMFIWGGLRKAYLTAVGRNPLV